MLRGKHEATAEHFGLNVSTVYKWCEDPTGSGHPIPANRIIPLCQFLDDWQVIEFLAMQSNRVLFKIPKAVKPKENIDQIMNVAVQFSDLLKATTETSNDKNINLPEFKRIDKEAFDLHAAIVNAVEYFRKQVKDE
jgi:hypothetical protein